jgi:hypothetical protein
VNLLTATVIIALITAACFAVMWLAWRKRSRKAAEILLPETVGDIHVAFTDVFYVATTPEAAPLDRVNIPGLTYRGYASVAVHTEGVSVQVRGERVRTIPANDIRSADTATTRIDKTVEHEGLAIAQWRWGQQPLETSLRFASLQDQKTFIHAVTELIERHPDAVPASEEPDRQPDKSRPESGALQEQDPHRTETTTSQDPNSKENT